MTREEKVDIVAKRVAEGGWSSIRSLVNDLTDAQLSYWFDEEEEEDDNG